MAGVGSGTVYVRSQATIFTRWAVTGLQYDAAAKRLAARKPEWEIRVGGTALIVGEDLNSQQRRVFQNGQLLTHDEGGRGAWRRKVEQSTSG